ncbi:MAG: hypothetical protein FGF52_06510 [Candidatus Brockarchaeota archaeon]|nr:hypothetical protein [Candidatus Brockarchaeota archaeon]
MKRLVARYRLTAVILFGSRTGGLGNLERLHFAHDKRLGEKMDRIGDVDEGKAPRKDYEILLEAFS